MERYSFELNKYIEEKRLDELIEITEAEKNEQYEIIIKNICDPSFGRAKDGTTLVLVTGPSSSGKTTFSHVLKNKLLARGRSAYYYSLDDYYYDRSEIFKRQGLDESKSNEKGMVDFESIDDFDIPLFRKDVCEFVAGKTVIPPAFDFNSGTRQKGEFPFVPKGNDILICEGIQAMNPSVYEGLPVANILKIYICPFDVYSSGGGAEVIDSRQIRFMRRAIRDNEKRKAPLMTTYNMWDSVVRGEQKYIGPMRKHADLFFNSSFRYEIHYLKYKFEKMYEELSEEDQKRICSIVNFESLSDFKSVAKLSIPEDSIFNEFYLEKTEAKTI